jgi:hypothetical protein
VSRQLLGSGVEVAMGGAWCVVCGVWCGCWRVQRAQAVQVCRCREAIPNPSPSGPCRPLRICTQSPPQLHRGRGAVPTPGPGFEITQPEGRRGAHPAQPPRTARVPHDAQTGQLAAYLLNNKAQRPQRRAGHNHHHRRPPKAPATTQPLPPPRHRTAVLRLQPQLLHLALLG